MTGPGCCLSWTATKGARRDKHNKKWPEFSEQTDLDKQPTNKHRHTHTHKSLTAGDTTTTFSFFPFPPLFYTTDPAAAASDVLNDVK